MSKPSRNEQSKIIAMSSQWFGTSIVVFELLVCVGAYFAPDLIAQSCERFKYKVWSYFAVLGVLGLSALGVSAHVVLALRRAPDQRRWLQFVFVGYGVTIALFAAVYFVLISLGDVSRAADQDFLRFLHDPKKLGDVPVKVLEEEVADSAPFHGINQRLIVGILDSPPIKEWPYSLKFRTAAEALEAIESNRYDPVWVLSDHKPSVYLDCLHFSIVTAATVGYGDIYPVSRTAKVLVDLQILSSTVILIIGFGFALNSKNNSSEKCANH